MDNLKRGSDLLEVESKNLIAKANELNKVQHRNLSANKPQRSSEQSLQQNISLSLADRAARLNNEFNSELPAIEEAFDKENDTFAQGGPIAALQLAGKRREAAR